MTGAWDPEQYERFAAERRLPFDDLVALCSPTGGGEVVDLGCGTGDLTAELHVMAEAERTLGIDSSKSMIERAHSRWGGISGLSFYEGDLGEWMGPPVDLVFANASFHWVPDHEALLRRLAEGIRSGGQLAFQVPANFGHVSHLVAKELAAEAPFAKALGREPMYDAARSVLAPERYAVILDSLGALEQHVRLQVYGHKLASTSEVAEWVSGTLLTPYRSRLSEEDFEAFMTRYRKLLLEEVGDQRPYFYTFPRILCWARFG